MALLRRRKGPGVGGISPFKAGVIGIIIISIVSVFGFTRLNPFKQPFQLKAVMQSANNLRADSPVRIAGVNVGKVKLVEAMKGGGARVTMEIEPPGLPIHTDAQLKIRPRIFLEGNFFVDISPGTPSAPVFESGDTVPIQQTATPVQFGQLLTALQRDTREDLQTLLYEYAQRGLGNGGARAYNEMLDVAPEALRNSSIANEASLGQRPRDLSNLVRGQQRLFASLSANPGALKDLVTHLNTTAAAFAREDAALEQAIPLLRDTLLAGEPALESIDNALPSLRAFSREALPGVRSSGPAIDASLPMIEQLRLLVRPQELRGLVADLRPTIPALARLNRGSIGLLNQSRALSACTVNVLAPYGFAGIPNPEEEELDNQPVYKTLQRTLPSLSGESRLADANTPVFHFQLGSGPANIVYTREGGENFIATAPAPPDGIRPTKQDDPPVYRPGEPCEEQEPPNLNAPSAQGDPTRLVTAPGGLLPPLPIPFNQEVAKQGEIQLNQIRDYLQRSAAGKPAPDPIVQPSRAYLREMEELGHEVLPSGKVVDGGAK